MISFSLTPQHFQVSKGQLQSVIKKFGDNLMFFISYLTDVMTESNLSHYSPPPPPPKLLTELKFKF